MRADADRDGSAQPTGTLTFLFTDIEGSTRRWQKHPDEMRLALELHDHLLSSAVEAHGGTVFKHTGDGICAVFTTAHDAVRAAVDAQLHVGSAGWPDPAHPLTVRTGVHTGDAQNRDGDYFGPVLNRTARIMDAAHGGQILVSGVTAALLSEDMPDGVGLRDLGDHRLRDLLTSERLHQVCAPGLRSDFPPLVSLDAFQHNLPVQRTAFIGREEQVADVVRRLEAAALVTLIGIGGAGKTRLALEAAAEVVHHFPDGVFFVDLGPLGDGDLVEGAVAAAAGIQRGGAAGAAGDIGEDLLSFLARRTALLVLDNCEHLLDDCAELVDDVLAGCPEVKVLATSREPLSLEGEHTIRVGSMSTEGPGAEAVKLFHDRARAIDHTFEPAAHADAIANICHRLDGIPLAIELAAAQVRHLTPADIAARLDDRFGLLVGGRRRVQRQQTLEAMLDWSHDLLDETERVTLRRLAVFAGPFALGDAEVIVAEEAIPRSRMAQLLGALVDKSLVTTVESDGSYRYRLLETVRMYAQQRLADSGEADAVRDRHRDHFLAKAESLDGWRRLFDHVYATGLWRDVENLRAAHEWSRSTGRLDLVARQVAASAGLYWIYGLVEEATEWSRIAMDAQDVGEDVAAWVRVVHGLGQMLRGEQRAAPSSFEAASRRAAFPSTRVLAQAWLGFSVLDDRARATEELEQARRLAEQEDPSLLPLIQFMLVSVYLFHYELEQAIDGFDQLQETVDAHPEWGPGGLNEDSFGPLWRAVALSLTGRSEEALALVDELDKAYYPWYEYAEPWALALIHAELGERDSAIEALQDSVVSLRRRSIPLATSDALLACAALAYTDGRPRETLDILGAVRGSGPYLTLRNPISFTVFRHYRDRAFNDLPLAEAKSAYHASRAAELSLVLDRELERLSSSARANQVGPQGR